MSVGSFYKLRGVSKLGMMELVNVVDVGQQVRPVVVPRLPQPDVGMSWSQDLRSRVLGYSETSEVSEMAE